MNDSSRSSMGCVVKGLIGLAICAVILVVGGILTGYYVIYHTALPAKGVVAMLNQIDGLQIDGVSGSISSGFGIKKIRYTDENGKTNSLDDIRLKYKKEGETFTITDIHVGRGYFYIDRSKKKTEVEAKGNNNQQSGQQNSFDSNPNARFIIAKVSINDITVEDVSSGEKFHLEKIELDSLELGKDHFEMGKLIVKSTDIDVKILPEDGSQGNVFIVSGDFKKTLHKNLVGPLDIKGKIDAADPKNVKVDLTAFGGKLTIKGDQKKRKFQCKELTLADYFKNAPPITDINLVITQNKKSGKAVGSFMVAEKKFEIDQEIAGSDSKKDEDLIATHKAGDVTYELKIASSTKDSESIFPKMKLTTKPTMPAPDAVAKLLTGKTYNSLAAAEKEKVKKALEHFTPKEK